MRGFGQIAELTAICEPDVGVITNIGPVHLEQMGSLEGVAQAKAELVEGLRDGGDGGRAVRRAAARALPAPGARRSSRSGPAATSPSRGARCAAVRSRTPRPSTTSWSPGASGSSSSCPFDSRHNLRNTLAAVAAARAVGVRPEGRVDVRFSALRGERVALGRGATVVNDCYNANPLSMRAALDDLAMQQPAGRRVAVLGDMLELGPAEAEHHREIGAYAAAAGVDVLVAVGPRSAAMLEAFDGEAYAARRRGGGGRRWRTGWCGRATSCWSRRRAASGSRSSPRRWPGRPAADGRGPHRRYGLAAHLHLPLAQVHRVPAAPRVRPADPRGGAAGAPREGGNADDGRADHLHRDRRAVPHAHGVRPAGGRRARAWRWPARRSASPTTT